MLFLRILAVASSVLCQTVRQDKNGGYSVSNGDLELGIDKAGSLYSIVYKGIQWAAKTTAQGGIHKLSSAFGSGLSDAHVSSYKKNDATIIAISGRDQQAGKLNAYFIFRPGDDNMYIGVNPEGSSVGELRFLLRLDNKVFPHGVNEACNVAGGSPVEGKDVFKVDGATRSKFYSSVPMIYNQVYGVTSNTGQGIYFALSQESFESMSGGPFFRDITSQGTTEGQQLSAYLYSGHAQSEPYRSGLKFITLSFGRRPDVAPDLKFLHELGLSGSTPSPQRGEVRGNVKNMQSLPNGCTRSRDWYSHLSRSDVQSLSQVRKRHEHTPHKDKHVADNRPSDGVQEYTVVLNNERAQYWSQVDQGGNFRIDGMLAGRYHVKLYQDQREVQATDLVLDRGGLTQVSIEVPTEQATIWSIGCHDGRPHGFLNADKFERMHPSDRRMSSWLPSTVSVGDARQFPMAQIAGLNPTTIRFTLSAEEASRPRTLLIMTTAHVNRGRPFLKVNGTPQAPPPVPAHLQVYGKLVYESRVFTRGAHLLSPATYTFALQLKAGENEIVIDVAGEPSPGLSPFLQPTFLYDYVALV